jgi:peptide alpha-N-acetyltransferase
MENTLTTNTPEALENSCHTLEGQQQSNKENGCLTNLQFNSDGDLSGQLNGLAICDLPRTNGLVEESFQIRENGEDSSIKPFDDNCATQEVEALDSNNSSSDKNEVDTCRPKECDSLSSLNFSSKNVSSDSNHVLNVSKEVVKNEIDYVVYESEAQMPDIMRLITRDLSEPYSIYTYRYFIHNWPNLCFLAMSGAVCVGAIVCKLDLHKKIARRGYIAMLAVDQKFRRKGIASHLVLKAIRAMVADDCDEVVLETEITNNAALHLYENLGFVRDKRLFRYYLNGVDALRLKLWLR